MIESCARPLRRPWAASAPMPERPSRPSFERCKTATAGCARPPLRRYRRSIRQAAEGECMRPRMENSIRLVADMTSGGECRSPYGGYEQLQGDTVAVEGGRTYIYATGHAQSSWW